MNLIFIEIYNMQSESHCSLGGRCNNSFSAILVEDMSLRVGRIVWWHWLYDLRKVITISGSHFPREMMDHSVVICHVNGGQESANKCNSQVIL